MNNAKIWTKGIPAEHGSYLVYDPKLGASSVEAAIYRGSPGCDRTVHVNGESYSATEFAEIYPHVIWTKNDDQHFAKEYTLSEALEYSRTNNVLMYCSHIYLQCNPDYSVCMLEEITDGEFKSCPLRIQALIPSVRWRVAYIPRINLYPSMPARKALPASKAFLELENTALRRQVDGLNGALKLRKTEVDDLWRHREEIEAENATLKTCNEELEHRIVILKAKNAGLQKRCDELEKEHAKLNSDFEQTLNSSTGAVKAAETIAWLTVHRDMLLQRIRGLEVLRQRDNAAMTQSAEKVAALVYQNGTLENKCRKAEFDNQRFETLLATYEDKIKTLKANLEQARVENGKRERRIVSEQCSALSAARRDLLSALSACELVINGTYGSLCDLTREKESVL